MKLWCVNILIFGICAGLWSCQSASSDYRTPQIEEGIATDSLDAAPKPLPSKRLYSAKENSTEGSIHIAVDESLRPLIEEEIATFMALHPRATIQAHYLPGEAAIAHMLASDTIRMAISSRELTADEDALMRERIITVDYATIGFGAVSLLTHRDNPVKQLSLQQLRGIMSGQLQTWNEIEPEAPAQPIRLVFDHAQSGPKKFLQDSLLQGQMIKGERVFALDSTVSMLEYVRQQPWSLGVGGWAWVSDVDRPLARRYRQELTILSLERNPDTDSACVEQTNFFGPYQSYLAQRCYPLTRPIKTVLRETIYGLGTGFVAFLNGPAGQRILHKHGLCAVKGISRELRFPPKEGAKKIRKDLN
ncbi:MAG: substrate-binding domain-containing protein [Bacteroidota bacterium]